MIASTFQIPVFLFSLLISLIPIAVAIVAILFVLRVIIRAGKKTSNTIRY